MWMLTLAVCLLMNPTPGSHCCNCLPEGIKADSVVSTKIVRSSQGGRTIEKVTVEQKMRELRARCRNKKLVDSRGREIRFVTLEGCWGNPPADYQEILSKQREEIEKLKKRYTVVEMTCNPSGEQIP
jgi:hypothetical protein